MAKPGQVAVEQAYAQGKMLDHSGWPQRLGLGRKAFPSDIDAVIDYQANGKIVLMEWTSQHQHWVELNRGQRMLHQSFVIMGHGRIMSLLCNHSVPSTRQIDTAKDCLCFQVMRFSAGGFGYTTVAWPGHDGGVIPCSDKNSDHDGGILIDFIRKWITKP